MKQKKISKGSSSFSEIKEKKEYELRKKNEHDFKNKVANDLSNELEEIKEFIYSLLEKDSDEIRIESNYGNNYNIKYTEQTNNNGSGVKNAEPSNINIEINENEVRIQYYDSITQDYLDRYMIVDNKQYYDSMKDDLYQAYLSNMKQDFRKCLTSAYKICKLDRSKKIKGILDGEKI